MSTNSPLRPKWSEYLSPDFLSQVPTDPTEGLTYLLQFMPEPEISNQDQIEETVGFANHIVQYCDVKRLISPVSRHDDDVEEIHQWWREQHTEVRNYLIRRSWITHGILSNPIGYYVQLSIGAKSQIQNFLNEISELLPRLETTPKQLTKINRVIAKLRSEVEKTESNAEYFGALIILVAKNTGEAADQIIERAERIKKVFSGSQDDQLMLPEDEDDEPALLSSPQKQIEDQSEDD